MPTTKATTPTGVTKRDLGTNDQGYRQVVVSWRGELYRLSWKREEKGFKLDRGDGRVRVPYSLWIVVACCDQHGEALEDAEVRDAELLEELKGQATIFAAWGGA